MVLIKYSVIFISDIKHLKTNGINIHCNGKNHHFFSTISFISSDNLSAHTIEGYTVHFSTAKKSTEAVAYQIIF